MNTIVTFPIAKLVSKSGYSKDKYNHEHNDKEWELYGKNISKIYFPFPTIVDVVMWLYEKDGIWISVNELNKEKGFYYRIEKIDDVDSDIFNTPTEAYLAAIEFVLKNLIKE